ncbi:hypothetical protein V6N13_137424 [Hibiscus sabdariffa]|uniref:Uncharacterized protein n=1 Tax=Hibiscus sabdariffa TaxID=183260 RepID=A0ABR2DKR0_9ROSI
MRSQLTTSRQPPGREPDGEFDGRMDGCLAVEVAADRKRNECRLLPVIRAVWAGETTPDARRGVDGWSRLDGSGYRLSLRDRGDLRRRQLLRATYSTGADASRLQGRVPATTTVTGGASGAGETFRTDPDQRRLVWRRPERRRRQGLWVGVLS